MADFDLVAADFERHRAWPDCVAERIRAAVWDQIDIPDATILDLGAGTGRLGRAFVSAGDRYVGVDLSLGMLSQFSARMSSAESHPALVQANGCQLPFASKTFGGLLLAHVLSALPAWQDLLAESIRVLSPAGALILGRQSGSSEALDQRIRNRLNEILGDLGVEIPVPGAVRTQALQWLKDRSISHELLVATSWRISYTPRDCLLRYSTAARFVNLPKEIQQDSMKQLHAWSEVEFGEHDTEVHEERHFALDVFRFERL